MTNPLPGRAAVSRCRADQEMWRNLFLLAPFARPEHLPPFRATDRRRLWPRPIWHRASTPAEMPQQRQVPQGLPPRPRIQPRPVR